MKLASGNGHSGTCSGCPHCNEELARTLSMAPVEYAAWLQRRTAARSASSAPDKVGRFVHAAGCPHAERPTARSRLAAGDALGGTAALASAAPPPIDLVARIRAARARQAGTRLRTAKTTPSRSERLKAVMTRGVTYDHME
jgi:hypothetical protein